MIELIDNSDFLDIRSPYGVISGPRTGPDWQYVGQTWGTAVADIDNDGYLDLYVNHHVAISKEVLFNFGSSEPKHTFIGSSDRFYESGEPLDTHSATFFDIDQDGDLDLLETRGGALGRVVDEDWQRTWNQVYLNDGGTLVEDNAAPVFDVTYGPARGRALTPINVDGDLGLYYGVYPRPDGKYPSKLDILGADGKFHESDLLGSRHDDDYKAIGAHLGHNDKIDLIVIGSRGVLRIQNDLADGPQKENIQKFRHPDQSVADVQIADFDGDGILDVFAATASAKASVPDRIYRADGKGVLHDATAESGIGARKTYTVSATVGDFDNDGDIDIAALQRKNGIKILFWENDGTGKFTSSLYAKYDDDGRDSEILSGDFNNDGWLDFIVSTGHGGQTGKNIARGTYNLFTQDPGQANWLKISLKGVENEKNGLGARVTVFTQTGSKMLQEQDGGTHGAGQDSQVLHFGLGDTGRVPKVKIVWPDGDVQIIRQVEANRHILIEEDEPRYQILHCSGDGGSGPDRLVGCDGDDTIDGRGAGDVILGHGGDDVLRGSGGADRIDGGPGGDSLSGGAGRDTIDGGAHADTLDGGEGPDLLHGGEAGDLLIGAEGIDTLYGEAGDDSVFGGPGDDTLGGGKGNDLLSAGEGADEVFGGAGSDTAYGGDAADLMTGGPGSDRLIGGGGSDRIYGGSGNDRIGGDAGHDTLLGGAGRDQLFGSGGDDVLDGKKGDDVMAGGDGNDRFRFDPQGGIDTIEDFEAGAALADRIRLAGFGPAFDTFAEVMAAATEVGADTHIAFDDDTVLIIENVQIAQFAPNDFLFA